MLTTEQQNLAQPKLKTILIIYGALGMGMLMFLVTIGLIADWKKLSTEADMMALMGAVVGLMTYGMSFIVPKLMSADPAEIAANLTKQSGTSAVPAEEVINSLVSNYTNNRIVAGALLEGGVFLNLIVFLIEPNTVSIAVALIGFLIFVFRFPFLGGQMAKLDSDLREVQRELTLLGK
jgi:hypothetical protein